MKTRILILILSLMCTVSLFSQNKVTIMEGTRVVLKNDEEISGKTSKAGDILNFTLSEPIIIGDRVVVKKGVKATGTVTDASGSKILGGKGKLDFTIDYIQLPDGKVVKLRYSQQGVNTKGRGAMVAAGAILVSPLALLIKGKQAIVKPGTIFNVFVDKDIELELQSTNY
jgi:hypothetical protein